MASKWLLAMIVLMSSMLVKADFDEASASEDSSMEAGSGVDMLWPYMYASGFSGENMPSKRVLPYIVHKRMPYIVHKRMPYIVHKRMMSEDLGREEIARILDKYQPRALRMIPLIH